MIKILTWYWQQTPSRGNFDAEKVNRWAAQLRPNLTIPYTLACVTDDPRGIDPDIEIIPPPREFDDIAIKDWTERSGMPQCYRRLTMFAPHAADLFGAERFVCTDIDMIAIGNLDELFDHDDEVRIFSGTSSKRPYNGSMLQITAGARSQVYDEFRADPVGMAAKARKLYIGSDQAVMSMILGKGEAVWNTEHGVYAWSQGFRRQHRNSQGVVLPPDNMKLMFFPGFDNPWDINRFRGVEWIPDAWHYNLQPPATVAQMSHAKQARRRRECLWAYDDPKRWGRLFHAAAAKSLTTRCRLFIRADRPPPDARCFVRLDQQAEQRDVSKQMVAELAERGAVTLPTPEEAIWYDDKVAQLPVLKQWMPHTLVIESEERARAIASAASRSLGGLSYPMVSKAAEGAASANVRVLHSEREAQAEVSQAFGRGIDITYGRKQRGYVYWQRLIPDQPCDYRVVCVGRYWYGLIRDVRPGTIKASGSGKFRIMFAESEREIAAARLCIEISQAINTQWMAYDVVFDGEQPLVLELSSAWTMKAYHDCPVFDYDMRPTGKTGADSFMIAVDILRTMG